MAWCCQQPPLLLTLQDPVHQGQQQQQQPEGHLLLPVLMLPLLVALPALLALHPPLLLPLPPLPLGVRVRELVASLSAVRQVLLPCSAAATGRLRP